MTKLRTTRLLGWCTFERNDGPNYPCPCSEMYLNGTYHWLTYKFILAFVMSHEVLWWMALPNLGNLWDVMTKKSSDALDRSIAVIVHVVEGIKKSFDIWVMREYGSCDSFNTHEIKNLNIIGVPFSLLVIYYVQSLVSVQGNEN